MRARRPNKERSLGRAQDASDTARLFFALWPDDPVRSALAALAQDYCMECGGRIVPAANLHLTLAFLGDVTLERVSHLVSLADAIAGRSFQLMIDTGGYFRHNRIVWAGAAHCPAPLRAIAAGLADAMRKNGFRHEAREYAPHITLLRNARRAPAARALTPVVWDVRDFVLMRSASRAGGSTYEVVQRWPFK